MESLLLAFLTISSVSVTHSFDFGQVLPIAEISIVQARHLLEVANSVDISCPYDLYHTKNGDFLVFCRA